MKQLIFKLKWWWYRFRYLGLGRIELIYDMMGYFDDSFISYKLPKRGTLFYIISRKTGDTQLIVPERVVYLTTTIVQVQEKANIYNFKLSL